jgi:DNA-binding LytR/AlgR family response regulator
MKVVVADDEEPARRLLVRLLGEIGGIEVVGEAATGVDALAIVGRTRPDVLLLDIDMPEMDGLELAARHADLPPVVFVTAHDEHAVRAFELDAVDYLLKPVGRERLAAALQRARARAGAGPADAALLAHARTDGIPRVVVRERDAILVFEATAIDRFHAADKYTLFTVEGREHATEESLLALEVRLAAHGFVRVHRGELVRISAIRALTTRDGMHEAQLRDGSSVRVSRRSLAALKAALGIQGSH